MENYFFDISLIVVGSGILAWIAVRLKQPILVGYFAAGVIFGPWGLSLINNTNLFENISHIGITLLLFLAGLVLHPNRLIRFFKIASFTTIISSLIATVFTTLFLIIFGFGVWESLIAGLALMFSSTVLAIKLMPTVKLHQKRMGNICIAILIFQDIIAVILIMSFGLKTSQNIWSFLLFLNLKLIIAVFVIMIFEKYVLRKMMKASERYEEILLMLSLGWCLGIAILAEYIGLSYEIGAFIAGVAMANSIIAPIISELLRPMRDFFLMFFFFLLGVNFDFVIVKTIWLPTTLLALLIIFSRPFYISWLLKIMGEKKKFSLELGFRLGQTSEFAFVIATVALNSGRLGSDVSQLVQLVTMLTMIISSYIVVFRFPTPIGVKKELKKS